MWVGMDRCGGKATEGRGGEGIYMSGVLGTVVSQRSDVWCSLKGAYNCSLRGVLLLYFFVR